MKSSIFGVKGRYNRSLGPLEKEHLSKLKDWRNIQVKVLRQYAPITDFQQENWFRHMKGDGSQVLFSLTEGRGSKKKFIGYCGITNIDFKNRRGEISFIVDPSRISNRNIYRMDFIAVLYMICQYGFEELNLNKIFTDTFEFRKDHIRILEGFGLRKEGVLRKHYFGRGGYFDSFIHSILASEWKGIKKHESKK